MSLTFLAFVRACCACARGGIVAAVARADPSANRAQRRCGHPAPAGLRCRRQRRGPLGRDDANVLGW